MKIKYDHNTNAAYIHLVDTANKLNDVSKTIELKTIALKNKRELEIMLDFDKDDKLLGIETLNADKFLPQNLLS